MTSREREVILYFPGVRWEDVPGTDRRLATALATRIPLIWVDPAVPLRMWLRCGGAAATGVDVVSEKLIRVRVAGPPGFTRKPMRRLADLIVRVRLRRIIGNLSLRPVATIVSSPLTPFPARQFGTNILYLTDDWVGGAEMLGVSADAIRRAVDKNLRRADIVAAVTPLLVEKMAADHPVPLILPNGCQIDTVEELTPDSPVPPSSAILMGQLNERIDVRLVEAVADRGVRVVVVGPRTDQTPTAAERLDRLLGHPKVEWIGHRPATEMGHLLRQSAVGLTPYVDNDFNRASFPLKTLEYLASGLPVVSTDLPAVRWLGSPHIHVAKTPGEFADQVAAVLAGEMHESRQRRIDRRSFAAAHSWDARAKVLLDTIQCARTVGNTVNNAVHA